MWSRTARLVSPTLAPPAVRGPNDRQARPKLEPCPASRDCCDRSRGTGVPSARAARGATRRHSARARSAQAARGARPAAAPRKSRRPDRKLIDGLWGESPPETVRAALQVYVAGLRKALGDGQGTLSTKAPGYKLTLAPGALDLDRFEQLRDEARACDDPKRRSALLREALALWRDAPLERVRRRAVRRDRSRAAGGATARSPRGANRRRPRGRPPRRGRARPRRAGTRAALPRALPRTADGCALSIRPAGGRPRGLSRHPSRPSLRASASSPGPSSRGSSAPCSSKTRRSTRLGSSLPRRHPRRTAAGAVGPISSGWPASSRRP